MACALLLAPQVDAFETEGILQLKWRVNLGGQLEASSQINDLYVEDIDADGFGEVLLVSAGSQTIGGVARNNGVQVFRDDGTLWWKQGTQEQLRTSYVGDLDNDETLEVILSSGGMANNIQRGTVYVLSEGGDLEERSHSTRMITCLAVADVDGDKFPDIIGGSSLQVFLFDKYGKTAWDYLVESDVRAVGAGSLDMEDDVEVVVGADQVYVLSDDGVLLGNLTLGDAIVSVTVADVSPGFGHEVYVITEDNVIHNVGIEKVKPATGQTTKIFFLISKWRYALGEKITAHLVDNFDSDEAQEILVGTEAGNLYLIDHTGLISWRKLKVARGSITSLDVADIDFDDTREILGASTDKRLFVYDIRGAFEWTFDVREPVFSARAYDLDDNQFMDVVVATSWKNLNVYELNKTYVKLGMAEAAFRRAQGNFTRSNFEAAISNLNQAKKLYAELGDVQGLRECERLETQIDEKIDFERRQEADAYFERAQEIFIEGNCKKALEYNNQAMQIFVEMGDSESILKAELLQLRIDECLKQAPTPVSTLPVNQTQTTTLSPVDNTLVLYAVGGVGLLIVLALLGKRMRGRAAPDTGAQEGGFREVGLEESEWDEILNE